MEVLGPKCNERSGTLRFEWRCCTPRLPAAAVAFHPPAPIGLFLASMPFIAHRKRVLELIREELRRLNYLPVVFDFDKPATRDLTETVSTLAHIAKFVIADITEARSIPQELERIVPDLPSVPVQPLLEMSEEEYGCSSTSRNIRGS